MTAKKNNVTKVTQTNFGLSFASANPAEYPVAYQEELWDRAAEGSALAALMGGVGQYDQSSINEAIVNALGGQQNNNDNSETSVLTIRERLLLNGQIPALPNESELFFEHWIREEYDEHGNPYLRMTMPPTDADSNSGLNISDKPIVIPAKIIHAGRILEVRKIDVLQFSKKYSGYQGWTNVYLPNTITDFGLVAKSKQDSSDEIKVRLYFGGIVNFNPTAVEVGSNGFMQVDAVEICLHYESRQPIASEYLSLYNSCIKISDTDWEEPYDSPVAVPDSYVVPLRRANFVQDLLALNGLLVRDIEYYEQRGFVFNYSQPEDSWEYYEEDEIYLMVDVTNWTDDYCFIPQKVRVDNRIFKVKTYGGFQNDRNDRDVINILGFYRSCTIALPRTVTTIYGGNFIQRFNDIFLYCYETGDNGTITLQIFAPSELESINDIYVVNNDYYNDRTQCTNLIFRLEGNSVDSDFNEAFGVCKLFNQPMPFLFDLNLGANASSGNGSQQTQSQSSNRQVFTLPALYSFEIENAQRGSNYVPCNGEYDANETYYYRDESANIYTANISSEADFDDAMDNYGELLVERGKCYVLSPEAYGNIADPIVQVRSATTGEIVDCRITIARFGNSSEGVSGLIQNVGDIEIATTSTDDLRVVIL